MTNSTFFSKPKQDPDRDDVKTPLIIIPTHNKTPILYKSPGVSFPRSCFNTTNSLTGIGVLSMPYALAQGGWLSLVFFFIIAVIFCYTGHLLERCMISNPAIRTYADVGEVAFGYKGKLVVAIIMYVELYITAVSYLILEGDNLDKMFPNTNIEFANISIGGKQLFVLLVGLAILPTTWLRNLGIIAYFSAVGVFASFLLFGMLVWAGISDNDFHIKGELLNVSGLPMAMGLYAICFCGHAIFPTVYTSMKDSTRFSQVLLVAYAAGTLNCGLVAICGYLMYGNDTQSQVTLNLPAAKLYAKLAIYTTLVTPLTKYAWTLTPIALAIEDRFFAHNNKDKPNLICRTLLVIGTIVIAITLPFFGYVMAFLGSFLGITVSILFPCACYLKIFGGVGLLGKLQLAKIICILVFGIIVCITGTYSSVKEIVNGLR